MFKITATFEDFSMVLTSDNGSSYSGAFSDGPTGETKQVSLTAKQVEHIMAFNLDMDGEPKATTLEERYKDLEAWLLEHDIPATLRPMP